MSVLERLYRIPDSETVSLRPAGLLVLPPPSSVRSGPAAGGRRRIGPPCQFGLPPAVAARACLMIASQDSSSIQRARRPAPALQPFTESAGGVRRPSRRTVSRSADGRPTAHEPAN